MAADPALASTDEQGAYLRKTVLNGVADEFRERQAPAPGPFPSTRPPTTGQPMSDEASCPMHARRISSGWRAWRALQELPSASARPVLSRFDGLTQDEVAARMQISRRMVVKHLARAIAYRVGALCYGCADAAAASARRRSGRLDKNNSDSAP